MLSKGVNLLKSKSWRLFDIEYLISSSSSIISNAHFQCYVNCVLELMQVSKKGKLNYDSAIKQINSMLPEHLREDYINGLNTCKEAGNNKCNDLYRRWKMCLTILLLFFSTFLQQKESKIIAKHRSHCWNAFTPPTPSLYFHKSVSVFFSIQLAWIE